MGVANRFTLALSGLLAGLVLSPAPASATCLAEREPNDAMATAQAMANAFCVAGAVANADQDTFLWQVDGTSRWTLTLQGLPGQDAHLQVFALYFAEDGATAVEATRLVDATGSPDAASPTATLLPGRYGVLVSSDTGSLIYRLTAAASPAPVPPPGPVGPQAGAFSLTTAAGTEIDIPWTIDASAAAQRWTLAVTAPLGSPATLMLRDDAGGIVATAIAADPTGTVRLADLALGAGTYRVSAFGLPEGGGVAVRSVPAGPRRTDVEEEPNDDPDHAFALTPGTIVSGRLVGTVATDDRDCFAVTIDAAAGGHRFDAVARTDGTADLRLDLIGDDGLPAQQRSHPAEVRLTDMVLAAGRRVICLAGALADDAGYSVTLEDRGAGTDGAEREPNDTPMTASTLSPEGSAFGTLADGDIDDFRLSVDGDSQLWRVQAAGDGLARLTLFDASGTPVVESIAEPGGSLLRLPDTPLTAADYVIEVAGTDGRYLLRAAPIGPALSTRDPGALPELEPNGAVETAMALTWGRPIEGQLADGADSDVFRLSLPADTHVRLSLTVPGTIAVTGSLAWGESLFQLGRLDTVATGADLADVVWNGVLPPGDHYLALSSWQAAASPYRLLAERLSIFDLPADREPNDRWWQAAPLPADGHLVGTLTAQDVDWYRLPPLAAPGDLVIRSRSPTDMLEGAYLELVEAVDAPPGAWPLRATTDLVTPVHDAGGWHAALPAGIDAYLAIQYATGAYDATVTLGGQPAAAPPPARLTADLSLAEPEVAAFAPLAQGVAGALHLVNAGDAVEVTLVAHAGDARWAVTLPAGTQALPAGGDVTVPIAVTVPPQAPDDGPVPVDIAVRDAGGSQVIAAATITPVSGRPPVRPQRRWPLPDPLLGGINVAWSALGGASLDDHPALNDGLATATGTVSLPNYVLATLQPTIDLAGDTPVEVLGVILDPGNLTTDERLGDFSILVSTDGERFTPALTARLSPLAMAQPFLFPHPLPARFIRLVPLGSQGSDSYVTVAELKAVAAPTALPAGMLIDGSADIARAEVGGHIVWLRPPSEDATAPLPDAADAPPAAEWAIGFLRGRAARITALDWQDDPATPGEDWAGRVVASASLAGAGGPWVQIGDWALPGSGSRLALATPQWARYLRLAAYPSTGQASLTLPRHVAVLEAPVADGYRSILGEWGDDDAAAIYELLEPALPERPDTGASAIGHAPRPLALDAEAAGIVRRADGSDRYILDIPDGLDRIELVVGEPPGARVGLALSTADGAPVALDRRDATADHTRYVATVEAGPHTVEVVQPPASVAVLWDTSGSVQQMQPVMQAVVADLINRLDAEDTALNLFPFRGEVAPLLPDFTTDRRQLNQALAGYDWQDSSSDAELVLMTAAEALFQADGARAIVLLTDGESEPSPLAAALWTRLAQVRPAIVGVLMPSIVAGEDRWRPIGLVRDWALAGGGFDIRAGASRRDYELAWRRLAASLDRPAAYTLTATAPVESEPADGPPGFLTIETGPDAVPGTAGGLPAIEVLLDVSGSMLQPTADGLRIDVARATLTRLVEQLLPPGAPFALRLFGQGQRGTCDTTLAVAAGPLDSAGATAAIAALQPVDGARTPIAEALRLAAEDLSVLPPPRLAILVTDGEETCGGDPAAEIERLRAAGVDTRMSIVGFAVADPAVDETFRRWADLGGGLYLRADDAASFDRALDDAVRPVVVVRTRDGLAVAGTTIGGPPLAIAPGTYRVDFGDGTDPLDVTISAGRTTVLTAP
ncbi:MAG: VWA domain-containing protein [Rhodospirillaceae bacterium]|nr:VWA domain-containing protein [Rhodospirillaceae bacterium]